MTVFGIVNQKGGTGKSTTAVHFSMWLAKRGSVILIDADAQQSSSIWMEQAQSEQFQIPYRAILDPEVLFETLDALKTEYDAVVVDGPGSLSEVTKAILGVCDVAIVPCQPSGLDLSSSLKILRILNNVQKMRAGRPHIGLFLSRAIKNTIQLRQAIEVLDAQKLPLLQNPIYQRQCLSDPPATAFDLVDSAAKAAADDYDRLFTEVLSLV